MMHLNRLRFTLMLDQLVKEYVIQDLLISLFAHQFDYFVHVKFSVFLPLVILLYSLVLIQFLYSIG